VTAPVRPRALVHRGVVVARGFVVDERALGPDRARARVLAHWEPGARVVRLGDGELALLLPRPRPIATRASPGAPLADAADALSAAPLAPGELAALAPARGAIVQVKAGEALAHARPEPIDPSSWLDLAPFAIVDARPLGEAPPAPRLAVQPVHASVREVFGQAVAPPPPEMREALNAFTKAREGLPPADEGAGPGAARAGLAQAALVAAAAFAALAARLVAGLGKLGAGRPGGRAGDESPEKASVRPSPSGAAGAAHGLAWLAPFFALLGRFFGASPAEGRATLGGGGRGGGASAPLAKAEPRSEGRLQAFLQRLLLRSRLGALLGRRQAQYVRTMLRLFDEGDLDLALRYAIPLGDESGGEALPALGVPKPRAELTIALGRPGAATSLGFDGLFDHLKQLYRHTFERLDERGRHQEAAFVLAELLRQNEEAVSYLERKGELRLAAELAEARDLPPPLVVRQWLLAGDAPRAVLIARRHDAFAPAVEKLGDAPAGRELRLLWAQTLGDAGRYAAAVDVAARLPEAKPLALAWADRGIELGGEAGARLLARRPGLDTPPVEPVGVRVEGAAGRGPLAAERGAFVAQLVASIEARRREAEAYERLRPTLEGWLAADGHEAHAARLALADQLTREAPRRAVRAMAGATLRALLRDYPAASSPWGRRECEALARAAHDAALEADLPPLPARKTKQLLVQNSASADFNYDTYDTGSQAIYDVAALPGGRLLVALGEAGAALLGPTGKPLASFRRPAHRLVVSDEGDRALALAPRGELTRLSRLDLIDRRSDDWCDAQIARWAETFDGERWVVASTRLGEGQVDLWIVDALDARWQALHRVPDLGKLALSIDRVGGECVLAVARGEHAIDSVERWRFRPACESLLERTACDAVATAALAAPGTLWSARALPQAGALALEVEGLGAPWLVSWTGREFAKAQLPGLEGEPVQIAALGEIVAVASRLPAEGACAVRVFHAARASEARPVAALRLSGAGRVRLRAGRGLIVACDDVGRVVSLDAEAGTIAHNVRL
jgi:MoxR-vWA-beta-propeller ternary system protein